MTDTIINKHNENKNTAGNITKRRRHPVYTIIALTALLIISAFLSIMLGSVQLKPADIMRCLTGSDKSSVTYVLIMNIRLPRMIGAIVAGMGLSVAGVRRSPVPLCRTDGSPADSLWSRCAGTTAFRTCSARCSAA